MELNLHCTYVLCCWEKRTDLPSRFTYANYKIFLFTGRNRRWQQNSCYFVVREIVIGKNYEGNSRLHSWYFWEWERKVTNANFPAKCMDIFLEMNEIHGETALLESPYLGEFSVTGQKPSCCLNASYAQNIQI